MKLPEKFSGWVKIPHETSNGPMVEVTQLPSNLNELLDLLKCIQSFNTPFTLLMNSGVTPFSSQEQLGYYILGLSDMWNILDSKFHEPVKNK